VVKGAAAFFDRAERDALQELEVTDGVYIADGVRRDRPLPADSRVDVGDERLGLGAAAQVIGREVASIRVAGDCEQQGLGGNLGKIAMTAPA